MTISEMLEHIKWQLEEYQKVVEDLQEENERLNTNLDELQNAIDNIAEIVGVPEGMCVEDVYDKIKDLQDRIDKAIEYIEKESWFLYKENEEVVSTTPVNKLLDILRGTDE